MTYFNSVKNQGTANRNPVRSEDWDLEEFLKSSEEGWDDDIAGQDEFIAGSKGASRAPLSLSEIQARVMQLKNQVAQSDQTPEEKGRLLQELKNLENLVDQSAALPPAKQKAQLAALQAKLGKIEAPILGIEEDGDIDDLDGGDGQKVNTAGVEKELNQLLKDLDGMTNLTEDEKVEYKAKLEKSLNKIKLAKGDPEKVDLDEIKDMMVELKDEADEANAYSPGLKGLAEAFDMEPEKVKGKAKAKGIDLDNLPKPPTKELMNFMAELSPELKEKFKKVEDAINERTKDIEKNEFEAQRISEHNGQKHTSGGHDKDVSAWENLCASKHFQDEKSKAVREAMQEAVKEMLPLFKALYPGEEVKAVEVSGAGGWERTEKEYKVADQIMIGGTNLDLFNNTDGKVQASTTPDQERAIKIPTIFYDGEGDGEWSPPKINTYGDKINFDDIEEGAFEAARDS